MLSAKRCGSTAIFKMFQKHPDVGVCHINQDIFRWEPNFWNLGAEAINGLPKKFISRFKESHPFLKLPKKFTEESLFKLWDDILCQLGPVVFDKSPQYLGNQYAMELLKKYIDKGNNVKIFAFMRDPRDAITSQYELWRSYVTRDSPKRRELEWLKKYSHLEFLQRNLKNIHLFRYEDFCSRLDYYAPKLLGYCGLDNLPYSYKHIHPISVGRYSTSINPSIRAWRFSKDFMEHLKHYGYKTPQLASGEKVRLTIKMLRGNIRREISSLKVRKNNVRGNDLAY